MSAPAGSLSRSPSSIDPFTPPPASKPAGGTIFGNPKSDLPKTEADELVLERLVTFNDERVEEEKRGLIRWLRP